MIVSHKHKFIYIKTRKTASTSVEIALSQFLGDQDIVTWIDPLDEKIRAGLGFRGPQNEEIPLPRYTPRNLAERLVRGKRARYYNHMPAREIRAYLGRKVWRTYYRFCIERNPWDRALSLYYWRTQHSAPRPPLLDFLRSLDRDELSNLHLYTYRIGRRLAVDHVAKYENLDTEMEHIRQTLSLPNKIELPHAKGSTRPDRRPYQDLMDHKARELVAQVCAREIALLGYTFRAAAPLTA